jgi:hypothetical protein
VHDYLKFHRFTIGRAWTADFGDPDVPADFDFMEPLSPVHNVPADRTLPPTLLLTADRACFPRSWTGRELTGAQTTTGWCRCTRSSSQRRCSMRARRTRTRCCSASRRRRGTARASRPSRGACGRAVGGSADGVGAGSRSRRTSGRSSRTRWG